MVLERRGGNETHTVYLPHSFVPLAQIHNGRVHHLHTDHLGTPLEASNDQGQITWRVTYKTWGNVLVQEEEQITQNLRFQGQYFDQETGLHYNRFRYYDPGPGRFVSQDPIGLLGGVNLFQYAPNPVEWVDPWGLLPRVKKPSEAQRAVEKGQGPKGIDRIDEPEKDVPNSQWHAHCPCGAGINQDGSIHDKKRAKEKSVLELFPKKALEWLKEAGWKIP